MVNEELRGVSLAAALQRDMAEHFYGYDAIADVVWAWFRANRDTLTSIAFTPSREAVGATDDKLSQDEMWEMRDFLTPILLTHFDALLDAATKIGQP